MLNELGSKLSQRVPWLLLGEILWRRSQGTEAVWDFQNARLRQLFRHAYEQVPYYRRKFEQANLCPTSFRGLEDLRKVPLSKKSDITLQTHGALVASSADPRRLILHCTSGTSGRPLRIYRNWHEERMLQLLRRVANFSHGWNPLLKQAIVSLPTSRKPNLPHRIVSRLGLFRERRFSCLENSDTLLQSLADYRPDILGGYPESLAALARDYSRSAHRAIEPRMISCGGGVLTKLARSQISQAFPSTPIYDVYGATEFNLVAWQCTESDYYHICDDGLVLEIIDEEGHPVQVGERGQVVGTALHSFAMPLIRMPLGDVAVKGPATCPCGASLGTLKKVEGRLSELFKLSRGRTVHPFLMLGPLDSLQADWLHRYRAVQVDIDHLVVELVARPVPDSREVTELRKLLSVGLPEDIRLEIRFVDEMPQESSGKFKFSVPLV